MELIVGTETRREYLSFELAKAARKTVEEVMPVKPGENVVITADTKSDARVVEATAQAVYALGAHPVVIWHETMPEANMEPPSPVAAALAAADVWFQYNVSSILYTEARLQAIYAGCRHACYGAMDADMMVRTIGKVNYPAMQKLEKKLEELSMAATEMRITSPASTDFRARIDKNPPAYVPGAGAPDKPGQGYSQMLGGSSGFWAVADSINGTIVFDGSISPPEELGILKSPVKLTLKDGRITAIEGAHEAKVYERWLASFEHEMMYRIAHLSFGCHPGITRLTGRNVEDERVFGCMNIGIGPTRLGAPNHSDGIFLNASVWADDVQLEDEGTYVHPDLVELCREMGVAGY